MISEIIINENKYDYRELIFKEFFDINKEKYIIIGIKFKNELLGIFICELIDKNGVVLFLKIDKLNLERFKEIVDFLFYKLEELFLKEDIKNVFCFYDDEREDNYFKEFLKSGDWLILED